MNYQTFLEDLTDVTFVQNLIQLIFRNLRKLFRFNIGIDNSYDIEIYIMASNKWEGAVISTTT